MDEKIKLKISSEWTCEERHVIKKILRNKIKHLKKTKKSFHKCFIWKNPYAAKVEEDLELIQYILKNIEVCSRLFLEENRDNLKYLIGIE